MTLSMIMMTLTTMAMTIGTFSSSNNMHDESSSENNDNNNDLDDNYTSDSASDNDNDEETQQPPSTEVVILIHNKHTQRDELFRVLLDSGTNRCMGTATAVQRSGLHIRQGRQHRFRTAAGVFTTENYARIRTHKLLELNSRRVLLNQKVQVRDGELGPYDFIFGRDYLKKFGIDLLFSEGVIAWDGMRTAMKPPQYYASSDNMKQTLLERTTGTNNIRASDDVFATEILDSLYERQDLKRLAEEQIHLDKAKRDQLYDMIFHGRDDSFAGRLGKWPTEKIGATLKPNAQPFHCGRPIRIPHIHLGTLKKEVDRLVSIGVIEPVDGATAGPWCAPSFIIPKKDGRVRFISDYRQLNRHIERRPFPMPHISDLIQDIGPYKYVTALDLSMGFYHFELDDELSDLTTFMLPWGLFKYRRLPMGLNISPDTFQAKISQLLAGLAGVRNYIDDVLIYTNGTYEEHLAQVRKVLDRLASKNLAVNARKSFWAVQEVDYLGFRLTPQGVKPQKKKVSAMAQLERPKTKKQLRRFIGLINFYRYMWRKRSHLLTPLSALTGKHVRFTWTDECERAFQAIKKEVSKEVMLSFPDYTQPFELFTDASDLQLGAVLKQGDKTLAFFSKKLNPAQQRYGVGEKEMLSVVEALKEFRTMVKGYPLTVFVDHRNWTFDNNMRNDRVLRWRLALEQFDLTFRYIAGEQNVVADALSRLPFADSLSDDDDDTLDDLFEIRNDVWRKFYQPMTIAEIGREQKTDPYLKRLQEQAPDRLGELFEDIGRQSGPDRALTEIDTTNQPSQQRIIVPATLTGRLISWYHAILVHPGAERLYNTLRQHYTWPKMHQQIKDYTQRCDACQRGKRGQKGRGKIPLKDPETEPWKDIALDLSGPWQATIDGRKVSFHTLTMIDVFTGWVEIVPIRTKKMEVIRDLFVQEWLRRYPRPSRAIFDAGGEFDNAVFRNDVCTDWFIKPEPITVRNPRANAIVERMHRVLGDMLRVQLTTAHEREDVVKELTSAAAYGIRATVHGVTKFSPGQMVFKKDMILRTHMEADTELVRQRRQAAIAVNNARENRRRIAHRYKKGDQVLILSGGMDPKLQLHQGPFRVLSYNVSNGTLHIRRNNYIEPINIRQVRPYYGTIRGGD